MVFPIKKVNRVGKGKEPPEAILARSHIFESPGLPSERTYAIALVNPRSKNLPLILHHLKQGSSYREIADDSGNRIYGGVFDATPDGLRAFHDAYWPLANWKTAFFFKDMQPVLNRYHDIMHWLPCFIESSASRDLAAYCCAISRVGPVAFFCPCHKLKDWTGIDPDRPSSPADQFYAMASRQGIINCPNFSMNNFVSAKGTANTSRAANPSSRSRGGGTVGSHTSRNIAYSGSPKNRWLALALCLFLGIFGVHRFYIGRPWSGLIQLFTAGLMGLWTIFDLVCILCGTLTDGSGRKLGGSSVAHTQSLNVPLDMRSK